MSVFPNPTMMPGLTMNSSYYSYYGNYDHMNDSYYLDAPIQDITLNSIRQLTAMIGIFLAILTFVINTLVIRCCLKNPAIRRDAFYIQIMNFGITNICVSVLVLPFTIYYIVYPWGLGQALCKVWIVLDIIIPCASMIILLIMTIDRILSMSHPNAYQHLFQNNTTKIALTPWIVAVVIVVPLWTPSDDGFVIVPGECIFANKRENAMLCHILTFFIPLVVLLSLTITMIILMFRNGSLKTNRRQLSSEELRLNNNSINNSVDETEGEKSNHIRTPSKRPSNVHPSSILCVCVVNALFVAMWSPFQFISILLTICTSHACVPPLLINQMVTWIGTASAAVTPLFWIIDRKVRVMLGRSCGCTGEGSEPLRQNSLNSEETFV